MVRMCVMLRMLRLHRYQKEETVDADPTLPCSLLSPLCPPTHYFLAFLSNRLVSPPRFKAEGHSQGAGSIWGRANRSMGSSDFPEITENIWKNCCLQHLWPLVCF